MPNKFSPASAATWRTTSRSGGGMERRERPQRGNRVAGLLATTNGGVFVRCAPPCKPRLECHRLHRCRVQLRWPALRWESRCESGAVPQLSPGTTVHLPLGISCRDPWEGGPVGRSGSQNIHLGPTVRGRLLRTPTGANDARWT
jgi:hypothetical protein